MTLHNNHITVLNGLRGFAALYVLIHHARLLLAQPYKYGLAIVPEKFSFIDKFLVYTFGLFKFGHEAVIIFFVLSGFVIHLKQAQVDFKYSKFSLNKFFKKRIIRLWPTLITAMLLCVLFDAICFLYLKESDVFQKYNRINFVQNILLIPNSADWGNNYPLWSLKHEWVFYLLYPCLLFLKTKQKLIPIIILSTTYLLYLLGIKIPILQNVAYTVLIWYLGVILADLYIKHNKRLKNVYPYFFVPILSYPLLDRNNIDTFPILDLVFGIFTMGLICCLLYNRFNKLNLFFNKFKLIGLYSYSLYLLHWPIQEFLQRIILKFSIHQTLPYHQWYTILGTVVSFSIAYLIYLVTEKPSLKFLKSYK
ncbi:MAG: acyltransferase [Pedobacter sp.]|nr:MAG: acyltransferase [Pedobacter sp.]